MSFFTLLTLFFSSFSLLSFVSSTDNGQELNNQKKKLYDEKLSDVKFHSYCANREETFRCLPSELVFLLFSCFFSVLVLVRLNSQVRF